MKLKVKNGAVATLSFEMGVVLGLVLAEWELAGLGEFVVTSMQDGAHMSTSRHYSGNAADIRTRQFFHEDSKQHDPKVQDFRTRLKALLGPHGIDVILHPEDLDAAPHLHIEYDPKPDQLRTLWGFTT